MDRKAPVDDDCQFCQIARGDQSARLVYESEDTLAFFPLKPATLGHTLVIPKLHYADIWSIDRRVAHEVFESSLRVSKALRAALDPEGLNLINSAGAAATQTVFHFHVHLVPRWKSDRIGDIWPKGDVYTEEMKDDVANTVREACTTFRDLEGVGLRGGGSG
jgi:histidine triad (HIT) family protein